MTVSGQGIVGHHRLMPSSWCDADEPLSSLRTAEVLSNLGQMHDEHFQYRVSQYGVGAAATGTTSPYIWSAWFPVTLTYNRNLPMLHARVACYTGSGTLTPVLRIVKAEHPWPAVSDEQALAVVNGSTTTSASGELVIDEFLDLDAKGGVPITVGVYEGDGTDRGNGYVCMLRADLVMTLAGSAGGSYFGAGEVQIREYVP